MAEGRSAEGSGPAQEGARHEVGQVAAAAPARRGSPAHQSSTSANRRVMREPKSGSRASLAWVVAGLERPQRKRAAWRRGRRGNAPPGEDGPGRPRAPRAAP
ncbi:hypothetical protein BE08_27600 [Sorangium cellulosum]|uniref:Uncharacterized protein n=1 Tax=Sorangium cellulosum TaxID=56 RepID=A0A150NZW8_SORCE|nr:hypothetical protein BE08_27600 [Sorangium cellulosum]